MKVINFNSFLNFIFYTSIFVVTQITGILLCLVICFVLRDFTWAFVRLSLVNSLLLGLSLVGSCYLIQQLMFKINTMYILIISFSVLTGTGILSFFIGLFLERTLFIYYDRGVFSFLFVNFLFVLTFCGFSAMLIIYREIMREKESAIVNERLLKNKMEMQLLSARTNPHFLFNTLNMIISLLKQPEKAETAILNLSDLLRVQLDQSDRSNISIDEELDNVRKYLDIQRMRFNDRLNYTISGDTGFLIPPLTIQPLVENCIKHNMQNVPSLSIAIEFFRNEDKNIIRIVDSVKALQPSMVGCGNGLTITKKRVENSNGTFNFRDGGIEISFKL